MRISPIRHNIFFVHLYTHYPKWVAELDNSVVIRGLNIQHSDSLPGKPCALVGDEMVKLVS